nr:retrotransposon protein, putative, Ty1-copia subclass [Tanacetum cinerariifolium]
MDVKTTFLNEHLSEEVYMQQPEGFVNPKYRNHVCKLKHSIYRLKQASRQWNNQFDDEIKKFGFTQNPDEPCVYLKASGSYIAILILYVDDILLMGKNIPMLQDVKSYLGRCFAMKDLGDAAYILGIKIYRDRSKQLIGLCQKAYIKKILKRYYMENSKRGTIPMQEKLKLSKSKDASTPAEKQRMQNIPYASVVGSIMYDVRCTRPDVCVHAKYIAAFDASKEAVWIRQFIYGLGIVPTIEEPISMYCDNTGAMAIAKDDGVTKGARHFCAKVHYLRETIKLGDVKIEKIDTDDNLTDLFIKALAFCYTQTPWIDYEETFSPVADIRAIRILIAIAAYYDCEIWQMDVKIAFLNGYLNEEVYMEQPEGFVNPKYPNRVCKLKRSIYGVKQASRQWNKRFDDEIKRFGFIQNRDEPCVYLKASGSNITFLILYVDNILIMRNSIPMLQSVKTYLGKCFAIKDLGEAAYIFGIKIYRDRSKRLIGLCQSAYIEKILKRYCMENSKRGSIPMQEKLKLSKSQGASTPAEMKRMQNVPYASVNSGDIHWTTVKNILKYLRNTKDMFLVYEGDLKRELKNITSRFQQNPGDIHWTTVKNIMKYLRNTKDMFLVYGGDLKRELRVSCYTNAGYLTDVDDLKSQIGYVFVLNGGAVDWKSAKQSI